MLGGGNSNIFGIFTPKIGEMIQFDYPKDPDPSKRAILRTRTPAIQVQTPPLEGPRILRVIFFKWVGKNHQVEWNVTCCTLRNQGQTSQWDGKKWDLNPFRSHPVWEDDMGPIHKGTRIFRGFFYHLPWTESYYYCGGFKYFLFSPLFGEDSHFWLIFFRWVETTNQITIVGDEIETMNFILGRGWWDSYLGGWGPKTRIRG